MEDVAEEGHGSIPGLHEDESISYESANSVSNGSNEDVVVVSFNQELDNAILVPPTRHRIRESHDFECIHNRSLERLSESSQINDSVPEDLHHVESFSGSSFELVENEEYYYLFLGQNSNFEAIVSSQISVSHISYDIEDLRASALLNESSNGFLYLDSLTHDIIDDSRTGRSSPHPQCVHPEQTQQNVHFSNDETMLKYSDWQNCPTTNETNTAYSDASDTHYSDRVTHPRFQNRAANNTRVSIEPSPVSFSFNGSENVAIVPPQNEPIQGTNDMEEEQITFAFGATVDLHVVEALDLPMPNLPYPS